MITSAITVASNGNTVLGAGATYGILLAILFLHGVVCSAATSVLARLNLFYVIVNSVSKYVHRNHSSLTIFSSWHDHCGYHRLACLFWRQQSVNQRSLHPF